MEKDKPLLLQEITSFCQELEQEFRSIPAERKEKLLLLSQYINNKFEARVTPKITVICTHNSRRSHLGQLWLAVGADYYQLSEIQTYSGGTEATAFNINAVNALRKVGFKIEAVFQKSKNPIYQINWKENALPYPAFSKVYDQSPNPKEDFAAVLVCTSADKGCPYVAGADLRLPLPFDDPKLFDGTALESSKYAERCRQIGREMLFVLNNAQTKGVKSNNFVKK